MSDRDCQCEFDEPDVTAAAYLALKFSIYMATVDYMIASYGPYAASATGGNGFARDFLAGVAAMYSVPSRSSVALGYSGPRSL